MKNTKLVIYVSIIVSVLPFIWLFTQSKLVGGDVYALANIAGLVGGSLLLWQFLLGFRLFSSLITKDLISVNDAHKTLGKYGIIFILIHPLLQLNAYGSSIFLSFDLSSEFMRHVIAGRTAFYLYLIVWVTSALLRSKIKYRPWAYIHYLSYPILLGVFLHARDIGTFIRTVPLVSLYWNALTIIFFVALCIRILYYFNVFKKRASLTKKTKVTDTITIFTLALKDRLDIEPGQFVNIRYSFFSEAHPYSVMEINKNGKEITLGIKSVGPHSKGFADVPTGTTLYIDGPYGIFTQQADARPNVILAGGIGITPFVEFVQRNPDNTYVFNSNRTTKDIIYRKVFQKILGNRYVDIVTQEKAKGKNVETSRITSSTIKKYVPDTILKECNVFICGNKSFMNACASYLQELGVDPQRIYLEAFSI